MFSSAFYSSVRSLFRVLTPPAVSVLKKIQNEIPVPFLSQLNKNLVTEQKHYTTSSKTIKPPTKPAGLAGRYAEALYSASVKMKSLEKVEADFQKLIDILKKDPRLRELLLSPGASKIIKVDDMKVILARLSLCPTTNNFMMTLTENRRLYLLESVIQAFLYSMSFHRGEIICEVTTAEPLQDAMKQKLVDQVRLAYKDRRTVTLVNIIDPNVLGGMVLKIDDYQIDMSIATRMKELKKLLSNPA